jgi:hypothetical protein
MISLYLRQFLDRGAFLDRPRWIAHRIGRANVGIGELERGQLVGASASEGDGDRCGPRRLMSVSLSDFFP